MNHKFRVIECEGIQIAASVETISMDPHPLYFPSSALIYVDQGEMHVTLDQEKFTFSTASYHLVKKYTSGNCHKTWSKQEQGAVIYIFLLQDEFIKEIINDFPIAKTNGSSSSQTEIFRLKSNNILIGLFESITTYIQGEENLDKELLQLKTKEAFLGIFKTHPEYIDFFTQFNQAVRADLKKFMLSNYQYNVPLAELAKMSGRSLSTFNRDFRNIFNESPHRWIMRMRLQKAKDLLVSTARSASEIYLELGFKDLAHFSRTFKKAFGVNPSKIKNA